MTKREYKYFKAEKYLSYAGQSFLVPSKHWHMTRRIAKMTLLKYIDWKAKQYVIPKWEVPVSNIGLTGGFDPITNEYFIHEFPIPSPSLQQVTNEGDKTLISIPDGKGGWKEIDIKYQQSPEP